MFWELKSEPELFKLGVGYIGEDEVTVGRRTGTEATSVVRNVQIRWYGKGDTK